jgi:PAS domain S-box-containing protein
MEGILKRKALLGWKTRFYVITSYGFLEEYDASPVPGKPPLHTINLAHCHVERTSSSTNRVLTFSLLRVNQKNIVFQAESKKSLRKWTRAIRACADKTPNTDTAAVVSSIDLAAFQCATVATDERGIVLAINSAFTTLLGYSESDIIGRNCSMLATGVHRAKHDQYLRAYLSSGNRRLIGKPRRVSAQSLDGSVVTVLLVLSEIFMGDKRRFLASILPESGGSNVVDTTAAPAVCALESGDIVAANSSITKLLGFTVDELIGANVSVLMPQRMRARHAQYMLRYARSGSASLIGRPRRVIAQHKDGSAVPIVLSLAEMLENGQRLLFATLIEEAAASSIAASMGSRIVAAAIGDADANNDDEDDDDDGDTDSGGGQSVFGDATDDNDSDEIEDDDNSNEDWTLPAVSPDTRVSALYAPRPTDRSISTSSIVTDLPATTMYANAQKMIMSIVSNEILALQDAEQALKLELKRQKDQYRRDKKAAAAAAAVAASASASAAAVAAATATASTTSTKEASKSLLTLNLDNIIVQERMSSGGGSSAAVYVCSIDGWRCAMKELQVERCSSSTVAKFLSEIELVESLPSHPHICRYLGHDRRGDTIRLFMTRYSTTLSSHLSRSPKPMPATVAKWMSNLVAGLRFLHERSIIHRDLKSDNIFGVYNERNEISSLAIGDFDQARLGDGSTVVGSPGFMAPEILLSSGSTSYTTAVDIYSLGMVLYEIIVGERPFAALSMIQIAHCIAQGERPEIPESLLPKYEQCKQLQLRMTARDPDQRPTLDEIDRELDVIARSQ